MIKVYSVKYLPGYELLARLSMGATGRKERISPVRTKILAINLKQR
jgi:hypothetical protein